VTDVRCIICGARIRGTLYTLGDRYVCSKESCLIAGAAAACRELPRAAIVRAIRRLKLSRPR
jgi:hypothetical protein